MDLRLKMLQMRDGRGRLVPRFYPPGQHPATRSDQARITYLQELVRHVSPKDLPAARKQLLYLQEKVAAFEEGETEAKYHGLKLMDERDRRRRGP